MNLINKIFGVVSFDVQETIGKALAKELPKIMEQIPLGSVQVFYGKELLRKRSFDYEVLP